MKGQEGPIELILYPGSWSGVSRYEGIKKADLSLLFLPALGVSRPTVTDPECYVLLQPPRYHTTHFPTLGKFGASRDKLGVGNACWGAQTGN